MHIKVSYRYLIYGILFGILFPILATLIVSYQEFGTISIETAINIQKNNLLLWIIDSAPLFLGLFALKAGLAQEKVNETNTYLKKKVAEQTKGINQINQQLRVEIKEKRDQEKILLNAMEDAQQGIKIKDQFLSNMSHEIRTPMNGIRGMTNLLLSTELSELQHKYLSAIDYSSKNLLVIINDILDLSKINSEKLEIEKINFKLRDVLDSVHKTFELKTNDKAIDLHLEIDENVPKKLCGDPVRINQILLNIVGNAVKFTEKGSVTILCKLHQQTEEEITIAFEVIDTGIGIKKENIKNVFENFSQANSTITRKFGGTGLGLPISKKLIELHGGVLGIESELGKGTSFSFTINFNHPLADTEKDMIEKGRIISEAQKSRVKILLAEDNKINQLVATKFLARFGFKADVANDGKEAIEMSIAKDYDLILMDVQMPQIDGLEATRIIKSNLKEKDKTIKVMAMTASVLRSEVDRCFDAGMDAFISKPFDPDDLYQKIINLTCGMEESVSN